MKSRWLRPFLEFIGYMTILSKEIDNTDRATPLLDVLYGAQYRFLNNIATGLDEGIHSFTCLKARQLGISTISLAIDVFWLTMHDGLQGALITDEESNKEKFRVLIKHYIASLPKGLRPKIVHDNRYLLSFANGSTLDLLVAGQKKSKVTLGQSRALNFVHATEVGSWGSEEGVASLIASLAQKHPHRLYIFESTAHGLNLFHNLWKQAQDDVTQKAFFIGWWSKEDYAFDTDSALFKEYWDGKLDDQERDACIQVAERYGHEVTPNQIAWHRWMRTAKITDDDLMAQNYPWTEDEAFIMTGRSFFPLRRITSDIKFIEDSRAPLKAYQYQMGENFLATQMEPVESTLDADLRVWEEPSRTGAYVMGVDPAYGRSDDTDGHCIELYRCYADKLVQVAEYYTPRPETYQVAWVMCHLAGTYRNVWINLEVTGPGFAVMSELRHLKQLLNSGFFNTSDSAINPDIFQSVKWYLYHKPDSLGAGYVYNWKTNADNKLLIMNQLRDSYNLSQLRVRSIPLLEEMQHTVQDGGNIEAYGRNHDDRVFASALATKAWVDWVRGNMIEGNYTYERVTEGERLMLERVEGDGANMVNYCVSEFFKQIEERREAIRDANAWAGEWQ